MVSLNLITVIVFYSIILFIILKFRKKFDIEAKFIALYRTKIGIKLMGTISKKFPRTVKFLGYLGIGVGFAGMAFIAWFLVDNMYKLMAVPDTAAGVSIVIPGVPIPGSPIFIPFWSGIISIFIIATVHEFSHGVVAKRFKVAVKKTGIVFFGPLIGAFVEPDEKKLAKLSKRKQLAMYAAGSWSNILLAVIALLILFFVIQPAWANTLNMQQLKVVGITEGLPAQQAGLQEGDIITSVNGVDVFTVTNFTNELKDVAPGNVVILETETGQHQVTTTNDPKNESNGYLGVQVYQAFKKDVVSRYGETLPWAWFYLSNFFYILGLLSAGIGFANLLPINIFDGGRMFKIFSDWAFKRQKKALMFAAYVSSIFIFLLVLNIAVPLIRAVF